jgi:MFS family permease
MSAAETKMKESAAGYGAAQGRPSLGSTEIAPAPRFLAVRLAALIFIAFAVMGAWFPVFTKHLKDLGFSPDAMAWASATNAIGAMLAPLIWGQIADRWLATERTISLCAAVTGILLWILAGQSDPTAVFLLCVAVWFFLIPVIGLTGAFIFRQLDHPEREYGKIRLWGTVGWMAANWGLTLWFEMAPRGFETRTLDLADSMRLGSLAAFVLVFYALTMPHTPPLRLPTVDRSWLANLADAPLSALRLFRDRTFFVYCACMFGFYITMPFTIQLNPLLLNELGVDGKQLPAYLTICQTAEVVCLALLPILLARFGARTTMIAGGLAWTLGLAVLSVGSPLWFVLSVLPMSGVFICCFVIAGQVFVNRQATHDIRASVQGLLVLVNGMGLLLGNLLVGWIRDLTGDNYEIAYRLAAMLSAGLVVLFCVGFVPAPAVAISPVESLVPDSEIP